MCVMQMGPSARTVAYLLLSRPGQSYPPLYVQYLWRETSPNQCFFLLLPDKKITIVTQTMKLSSNSGSVLSREATDQLSELTPIALDL